MKLLIRKFSPVDGHFLPNRSKYSLSILFTNSFSLRISVFFLIIIMVQQLLVGQGPLIIEASWSRPDTPPSIWLLWTSDQPDAETSTWQHTILKRDRCPCPWQDSNPQPQQAGSHRPALDHTATGIGFPHCYGPNYCSCKTRGQIIILLLWLFTWTYQTHVKYFCIMNNSIMTMTMND